MQTDTHTHTHTHTHTAGWRAGWIRALTDLRVLVSLAYWGSSVGAKQMKWWRGRQHGRSVKRKLKRQWSNAGRSASFASGGGWQPKTMQHAVLQLEYVHLSPVFKLAAVRAEQRKRRKTAASAETEGASF